MARPKGKRGTWFAEWNGESLPCVHDYWSKGIWPSYCDPHVDENSNWGPFIEAIKSGKKVILTNDVPDADGNPSGNRKDYIALFTVENVRVDGGKLKFDFVERLENFK